jgi:hypothetical protein
MSNQDATAGKRGQGRRNNGSSSAEELLTVELTEQEAKYVRATLESFIFGYLSDVAEMGTSSHGREEIRGILDRCDQRFAMLEGTAPFHYSDRRCELEDIASELLTLGANQIRGAAIAYSDKDDPVGMLVEQREQARIVEAGIAIFDQLNAQDA